MPRYHSFLRVSSSLLFLNGYLHLLQNPAPKKAARKNKDKENQNPPVAGKAIAKKGDKTAKQGPEDASSKNGEDRIQWLDFNILDKYADACASLKSEYRYVQCSMLAYV